MYIFEQFNDTQWHGRWNKEIIKRKSMIENNCLQFMHSGHMCIWWSFTTATQPELLSMMHFGAYMYIHIQWREKCNLFKYWHSSARTPSTWDWLPRLYCVRLHLRVHVNAAITPTSTNGSGYKIMYHFPYCICLEISQGMFQSMPGCFTPDKYMYSTCILTAN